MFHQTPKGFKAQKKMKNPAEGSDNLRPMGNLAGVAQWIEHGPVKQSERWFNSQSGHMPGFGGRSPVGGM